MKREFHNVILRIGDQEYPLGKLEFTESRESEEIQEIPSETPLAITITRKMIEPLHRMTREEITAVFNRRR